MATQSSITPKEPPRLHGGLPFVGHLYTHIKDRFSMYRQIFDECGDVGTAKFGSFTIYFLHHPELIQKVLVEHSYDFDKGKLFHNAFEPIIGDSLFIVEGDAHRKDRRIMAPAFQPRHIIEYANTMAHYSEQAQAVWQDGQTLDVSEGMTSLTMNIVGKTLFDADVFTETDELGVALKVVFEHVSHMLTDIFPLPLSVPTRRNRHTRQQVTLLRKRIEQMIDERLASDEESNDLLSLLLRTRQDDGTSMSKEQVIDESLTLFGAGHETTATALTWTWLLLSQNPEAYQRLLQEVDTVLQGRTPTYADLAQLPYTLQVFKEALRLYPPAYAISRAAHNDVEMGDFTIRNGQFAIVSIYMLHRHPRYYPNPEQFEPERFAPEREKQLPRYAYLPFGAGPRVCIGNHFAMMEGQILLASIAQHVRFELLPGQDLAPDASKTITVKPRQGKVQMRVHRR